jgi:hypothetical protein
MNNHHTSPSIEPLAPKVEESAREIRKAWKPDEQRRILDPVGYVVAAVLKSNVHDLGDFKEKAADLLEAKKHLNDAIDRHDAVRHRFLDAFYSVRMAMSWLLDEKVVSEDTGLTPANVAAILGKDPETLYNAIKRASDESHLRSILRVRDAVCVLCGQLIP